MIIVEHCVEDAKLLMTTTLFSIPVMDVVLYPYRGIETRNVSMKNTLITKNNFHGNFYFCSCLLVMLVMQLSEINFQIVRDSISQRTCAN